MSIGAIRQLSHSLEEFFNARIVNLFRTIMVPSVVVHHQQRDPSNPDAVGTDVEADDDGSKEPADHAFLGVKDIPTKKVARDHGLMALGSGTWTEAEVDEETKRIAKMKTVILSYVGRRIKSLIIEEATRLQMRNPRTKGRITNMTEITNAFSSCRGDLAFIGDVWYCFFGIFDLNPGWVADIERDTLDFMSVQYKQPEQLGRNTGRGPPRTGCIAKLIGLKKGGIVKSLNQSASKTHGISIRISCPNGSSTTRRVKGQFTEACYRRGMSMDGDEVSSSRSSVLTSQTLDGTGSRETEQSQTQHSDVDMEEGIETQDVNFEEMSKNELLRYIRTREKVVQVEREVSW